MRNTKKNGLLFFAPPCSTWVFMHLTCKLLSRVKWYVISWHACANTCTPCIHIDCAILNYTVVCFSLRWSKEFCFDGKDMAWPRWPWHKVCESGKRVLHEDDIYVSGLHDWRKTIWKTQTMEQCFLFKSSSHIERLSASCTKSMVCSPTWSSHMHRAANDFGAIAWIMTN